MTPNIDSYVKIEIEKAHNNYQKYINNLQLAGTVCLVLGVGIIPLVLVGFALIVYSIYIGSTSSSYKSHMLREYIQILNNYRSLYPASSTEISKEVKSKINWDYGLHL